MDGNGNVECGCVGTRNMDVRVDVVCGIWMGMWMWMGMNALKYVDANVNVQRGHKPPIGDKNTKFEQAARNRTIFAGANSAVTTVKT